MILARGTGFSCQDKGPSRRLGQLLAIRMQKLCLFGSIGHLHSKIPGGPLLQSQGCQKVCASLSGLF